MLLSTAVAAQEPREPSSRDQPSRMPESFTPPVGLCRLWIDGVPASQQPAPTDCASAIRNRPSNAAVIFGPKRRGESVELRSFTGRAAPLPLRQPAPDARAGARDENRDRKPDTTAKPTTRKPEKPQ